MESPKYNKSITDKISDIQALVMQRLSDININLFGSQTQILRINRSPVGKVTNTELNQSIFGDYQNNLNLEIWNNAKINYPFNDLEIFTRKTTTTTQEQDGTTSSQVAVTVGGMDITEILPIEMEIQFQGNFEEENIDLVVGDIIVDVFYDAKHTALPIILTVTKFRGSFLNKAIITKKAELAVFRGELNSDIQTAVNRYIDYIQTKRLEELNLSDPKHIS